MGLAIVNEAREQKIPPMCEQTRAVLIRRHVERVMGEFRRQGFNIPFSSAKSNQIEDILWGAFSEFYPLP